MASSWISSWVCSTVISCMRLKYGMCGVEEGERHLCAFQARVGRAGRGLLAVGEDRLEALPVGERTKGGIGGHEVVQMRGARAGQPADDDRRDDPLVEDLGVASDAGPR